MTWTYDPAQKTRLDRVRFLIGDTNENRQQLQNEPIEAILERQDNDYAAAHEACEALVAYLIANNKVPQAEALRKTCVELKSKIPKKVYSKVV
jgi:hypothetical protein